MAQYALGKDVSKPKKPDPDYVFRYPVDYAIETWQKYRESGVLPEAGGLNDQDANLIYGDWRYLSRAYNFYMDTERNADDDANDGIDSLLAQFSMPDQSPSWSDLTRD